MKKLTGILFAIFMVFLFLEILIGFPISLEHGPETVYVAETESDQDPKNKTPEELAKENLPSTETRQRAQGVHLVESKQGTRDWELFSDSAEDTSGKGAWKLDNVRVLFYNADKVDFVVTGKRGLISGDNKDMRIEGDVVTKSANGYVFQSNLVEYKSKQRLILSPDAVKMQGPPDEKGKGLNLSGVRMEAHVEESLMLIKENVTATKVLNDGKSFKIRSGTAEFSGKNRLARFGNEVSIEIGPMRMQGPEARFEYRPDGDILQSVVVQGGVKVSDEEKYATSDTVRFDPEQNKFTFKGRPRVVQNNDEITGEEIIFIDGGKKVKVEKIRARVEKDQ